MRRRPPRTVRVASTPRHGVARVISKLGAASRTEAARWVAEGRVQVNGKTVRDAELPVDRQRDRICVDGRELAAAPRLVVMLHKPRGLVTTTRDERGRDTVYRCFAAAALPWMAPVGRLDKASEGLLLFSNDPAWAAGITHPETGPEKTYHVQIDRIVPEPLLHTLEEGVTLDGERLAVKRARRLRGGSRKEWLEIVLDEGRNRHIRRLLETCDVAVLRLVRVAIGGLELGDLPRGGWRRLSPAEIAAAARG